MDSQNNFQRLSKRTRGSSVLSDTYEERWKEYENLFLFDDPVDENVALAWLVSEEKRRKIAELEKLLRDGESLSFFNKNIAMGLLKALQHFSRIQVDVLLKLLRSTTEQIGEGLQPKKDQEIFEGQTQSGAESVSFEPSLLDQVVETFEELVKKFYAIVGRNSDFAEKIEEIQALINVMWSLIEEASLLVKNAVDEGDNFDEKKLGRIKMRFLRTEQQLDALDPKNPFMGKAIK